MKNWKLTGIKWMGCLLLAVVCLFGVQTTARADIGVKGKAQMTAGGTQTLKVTSSTKGAKYTWTSSNEDVIKVKGNNKKAELTSVRAGKATITVTAEVDGAVADTGTFDVEAKLKTPKLGKAVASGMDSITINWKPVPAATGYRIYRKTGKGDYEVLGEDVQGQSADSYTDKTCKPGETYTYTVKAFCKWSVDVKAEWSDCVEKGISTKTTKFVPELTSLKVVSSTSVQLKWKAVSGAESYNVYRKVDGGKWQKIANVAKKTYTDKNVVCGTTYTYTVRGVSGSQLTSYNKEGLTIQAAPLQPKLLAATTKGKTRLEISWEPSEGADGYAVYRKNASGKWKKLATIAGISYEDTTVAYNTKYTYTVRAFTKVNGKKVWSGYDAKGITGKTVAAKKIKVGTPKLGKAVGSSYNSVTVSWKAVTGVDGYLVYRKNFSGKWKKIAQVKDSTATYYEDTNCDFGTKYVYTVRAYVQYDDTQVKSGYDAGGVLGTPKLAAPVLKSAEASGLSKIVVKWESVKGANGYNVYRKTEGTKWQKIKGVGENVTSYTDSNVKADTSYYYTVRAYRLVNGKKVFGLYDDNGVNGIAKITSKYVNGLKLYYDGNGNLIKDVESIIGPQDSYFIKVNKSKNVVTVYAKDDSGKYVVPVKSFVCSTGAATPIGTFSTPSKYRWHELMGPCWGQWCTRIHGGVLFHSVFYNRYNDNNSLSTSAFNKLGTQCSHGCVRLTAGDAKWIYDNCKLGTKVQIFNGSDIGPFGKPSAPKVSSGHTWDPTDPNMKYKCKQRGCH